MEEDGCIWTQVPSVCLQTAELDAEQCSEATWLCVESSSTAGEGYWWLCARLNMGRGRGEVAQSRGGTGTCCHLALVQPFLEGWAINFSPPSPPADCAPCQGKLKPAEYSFLCRHTFWLWSWRNISLAMGNLSQHCSCPCVSTSIGKD